MYIKKDMYVCENKLTGQMICRRIVIDTIFVLIPNGALTTSDIQSAYRMAAGPTLSCPHALVVIRR